MRNKIKFISHKNLDTLEELTNEFLSDNIEIKKIIYIKYIWRDKSHTCLICYLT